MNGAKRSHLVYLDPDFNFVRVNETYARTCGYRPEEMIGKNHFDLYPDAENEVIFKRVRDLGEPVEFRDKPFVFPDQPERGVTYWDWTLSPVLDSRGDVLGLVFSLFETTDRKKFELELSDAKAAAEEANRVKNEFLAKMSHEIRTPMTVFMAAIEQLLHMDDNPERLRLLNMADHSAQRLLTLIDDILDFTKIEAGRVNIESVPFDLSACIKGAANLFDLPAKQKGILLETEAAPGTPGKIIGDPDRLGQVLINLIGNAVKFTEQGKIVICVKRREDFLEFSVTDTGIGIPEEKQDQLFRSFSQLDAFATRKYGGSGLGLAISKGLVERMGGEIWVRSRKGEGTAFFFTHPLILMEENGKSTGGSHSTTSGEVSAEVRILVAEDEPMIRELIRRMLSRKNWQIAVCETGREALEKWRHGNFDLILMDLQLPEMDGLQATRAIREREAEEENPAVIIGLTAHARRETRDECLKAGMDHVLTKPIKIKDLFTAIERFLLKPRPSISP
jgi:PAS domain S-box-containing protein